MNVTIVLPISRSDYLRPVFECLDKLERPEDTELLIITDGDDNLARAVDRRLDSISYKRIQVINYGDQPGNDIDSRRWRIAAIHNKAKHFVSDNSEYVFLIEDDTTYPPDALNKLLDTINFSEAVAYAVGVQLGRHNTPYIGAWQQESETTIYSVIPPYQEEVEEIDAGGFYCCLTLARLYKQHSFEPYDKKGKNGLGCDVNYGLYIRDQRLVCLLNWSIQCDHIGEKGSVNMGNTKPVQVVFNKIGDTWRATTR